MARSRVQNIWRDGIVVSRPNPNPEGSRSIDAAFAEALLKGDFDRNHENPALRRMTASIRKAFSPPPEWLLAVCGFILAAFSRFERKEASARYLWFKALARRAAERAAPTGQRDSALWTMLEMLQVCPEFLDYARRTRKEVPPLNPDIRIMDEKGGWRRLPYDFKKDNPILVLRETLALGGFGQKVAKVVSRYLDPPSGGSAGASVEHTKNVEAKKDASASNECAFRHSADYRSVKWQGENFTFTSKQAPIVELLHKAAKNGTPEVSHAALLVEAGCEKSRRLRDLFKHHPAWGRLNNTGTTKKGTARLE